MAEPEPPEEPFDAVAAAAELEAILAGAPASAGPEPGELEEELAALGELLARRDEELRQAQARADRAAAEIERVQERVQREANRQVETRVREVLLALLEVADDLDRALAASRAPDHLAEVVAGAELVQRRLAATLERFGVARQLALHAPFDPALHEAVSTTPVDPAADGAVIAVVREGYGLAGEVLRPARVVVGRAAR